MAQGYPKWTGTYQVSQTGTTKRRALFFKERVPVFEFHNDIEDPLTLWHTAREFYRPYRHFDKFDFGSVPLILQGSVSPLAAPKSFALHDSCYEFHAVWTETGLCSLTRKEADDLLYHGMRAEGCSWWAVYKAWVAVRAFGGGMWKTHATVSPENLTRLESSLASRMNGTPDERLTPVQQELSICL